MPTITLNLPSPEEEELIRRFTVNKNYLQALNNHLSRKYGRGDKLLTGLRSAVQGHAAYNKLARGSPDVDEVRRFLLLAWTSEIQLQLPSLLGYEAMVGYANAWAPVHAYYAVYGALQAWFAADGQKATDHTAALALIANQIKRRNLLPEPWNLLAEGCPMRKEKLHLNVPPGEDCTGDVEVLSIPNPFGTDDTFWARYGKWLRTTRQARLLAREERWKTQNGKRNISPAIRTQFAKALSPTSFFDCMFRLRINSNYGAIDPYLVKHISQNEHGIFNDALCVVTRATVGLLELYVARRIGPTVYKPLVDDFLQQDQSGLTKSTLSVRATAFGY